MDLKRFNPAQAPHMHSIIVVGGVGAGKTELIQELLPHLKCSRTVIMSSREKTTREYVNVTPPQYIHDKYNDNVVGNILIQHINAFKIPVNCDSTCLVFDDCFPTDYWRNYLYTRILVINGKFLKLKNVFAIQPKITLPSELKHNMDYIFIFGTNSVEERRILLSNYADMFVLSSDLHDFCSYLDTYAQDPYSCIVIKIGYSNLFLENVFWYKAEPSWRKLVQRKKEQVDFIREELMAKTWHPSKLRRCLTVDEMREIFGEYSEV